MYLRYYNFSVKPFQINTDPKFLWLGEKHKEALATLRYAVLDNKGFLLLTGDVGTGKTTIVNALINLLGEDTIVAVIPDPSLKVIDFFNFVADAFKMGKKFSSKGDFINHLTKFLHSAYAKRKRVLLLIDEAQRLNRELLEEIRLLSNIEKQSAKLINIFFVGQPEFNDILLDIRNRAIRQRITINYNIDPLSEEETKRYIRHRLKIAGATKNIFTSSAMYEIFLFSKGYPRLTNIICDHALLSGYAKGKKIIDTDIVRECAGELKISPNKPPEKTTIREKGVTEKEGSSQGKIIGQRVEAETMIGKGTTNRKGSRIFFYLLFPVVFLLISIAAYIYHPYPIWKNIGIETLSFKAQGLTKTKETMSENDHVTGKVSNVFSKNSGNYGVSKPKASSQQNMETTNIRDLENISYSQQELEIGNKKPQQRHLPPLPQQYVIFFGFNSFEISDDALVNLNRLAEFMIQNPDVHAIARGYTDTLGNISYNKMLAGFRADIVKGYLVAKGINPARIRTYGMGPGYVKNDATTISNSSKRRVEIEIIKTGEKS